LVECRRLSSIRGSCGLQNDARCQGSCVARESCASETSATLKGPRNRTRLPSPTGCGEPWRFSSEMGTATREENASKQEARAVGSDSIRTGQCSGSAPADDRRSPVQWNEGRHRSSPPSPRVTARQLFSSPVRRTGAPRLVWHFSEFKSRRESDRRGGEPLFAMQEAAAAAQRAQRAIEI